ncbi:recombinase family protein [Epilithonimonas zeae]|uniref:recombinase family protein n=1 Tax=Epilithonimonas zeae TaxID=1416779 RepID=UPI00200BB2E3|nr:recombinase family protein [Epilithonimonas zeae]UQB69780.1 recombinase family protein [Epilithonimonas zeae]
MKIADLYIRVSTDEQADKGYSQRDQEERLRKHCISLNMTIGTVIYEDHSAKTFERPEWKKFLSAHKRLRGAKESRFLFFTKWDRFSRNTSEAYQMISTLNKLNITPQAIEQPLDLRVPENKLLLAIYLSTPEVENDRRALNVTYGMRRAIKEGRMMGIAPYGYINRSKEDGRKYVAVKEPEATNMIWAFKQVAKGHLPTAVVLKEMNKREGRKLTKNSFMEALRNVAYIGKLFLKAYNDEEERIVEGRHEPLISEELFMKVQNILYRKSNQDNFLPSGRIINEERYPLRGLLLCPHCNKNLTGSSAKGRSKHYYYYHCTTSCGFRYNSEIVNDLFVEELSKFSFKSGAETILKTILKQNFSVALNGLNYERKVYQNKLTTIEQRIEKARDMFIEDKLDEEDFRSIKIKYKGEIENLKFKLNSLKNSAENDNIGLKIGQALNAITNISERYKNASTIDKRAIVGLIYPEKLIFDGESFQTTKINSLASFIFLIKKELGNKKNRQRSENSSNVGLVNSTGFKPVTF